MQRLVTSDTGPLLSMARGLQRDFKAALHKWSASVEQYVSGGFADILKDINARFVGKEMPEEDRDEVCEEFMRMLPELEREYEHRLPQLVRECEDWN